MAVAKAGRPLMWAQGRSMWQAYFALCCAMVGLLSNSPLVHAGLAYEPDSTDTVYDDPPHSYLELTRPILLASLPAMGYEHLSALVDVLMELVHPSKQCWLTYGSAPAFPPTTQSCSHGTTLHLGDAYVREGSAQDTYTPSQSSTHSSPPSSQAGASRDEFTCSMLVEACGSSANSLRVMWKELALPVVVLSSVGGFRPHQSDAPDRFRAVEMSRAPLRAVEELFPLGLPGSEEWIPREQGRARDANATVPGLGMPLTALHVGNYSDYVHHLIHALQGRRTEATLNVRYEEMRAHPGMMLREILRHLEVPNEFHNHIVYRLLTLPRLSWTKFSPNESSLLLQSYAARFPTMATVPPLMQELLHTHRQLDEHLPCQWHLQECESPAIMRYISDHSGKRRGRRDGYASCQPRCQELQCPPNPPAVVDSQWSHLAGYGNGSGSQLPFYTGTKGRSEELIPQLNFQEVLVSSAGRQDDRGIVIFLDHGGFMYHAEVFYAVALRLQHIYTTTLQVGVTFIVEQEFAEHTGLDDFWEEFVEDEIDYRFVPAGEFRAVNVDWETEELAMFEGYRPLFEIDASMLVRGDLADSWKARFGYCNLDLPDGELYDVRAVVTTPKEFADTDDCACLARLRDNPQFAFVLHNPTRSYFQRLLLQWQNSFAATNANTVARLTPRRIGMGKLPVKPTPPTCESEDGQRLRPGVVVQGTLLHAKRNGIYAGGKVADYVDWLFAARPFLNFTLHVLTRQVLPGRWRTNGAGRLAYHQAYNMVDYHKAMLGSAIVLPLLSPERPETADYFRGHPSSSVAYAQALRMRVVGRVEMIAEYDQDFEGIGFYGHMQDTQESVCSALKEAIDDYHNWCDQVKANGGIPPFPWHSMEGGLRIETGVPQ